MKLIKNQIFKSKFQLLIWQTIRNKIIKLTLMEVITCREMLAIIHKEFSPNLLSWATTKRNNEVIGS